MKSWNSKVNRTSQTSLGIYIGLFSFSLALLLLLSLPVPSFANEGEHQSQNATRCIVCDSQKDPICREDVEGLGVHLKSKKGSKPNSRSDEEPENATHTQTEEPKESQGSRRRREEGSERQIGAGGGSSTESTLSSSTEDSSGGGSSTKRSRTKVSYSHLKHLESFEEECPAERTWCYKSEGRVVTVNYTGSEMQIWKVDRGCAKPYFEEACVRVIQEDGTDFRVCFCHEEHCNGEIDTFSWKVVNPNGAQGYRSSLGMVLLGLILPFFWVHFFGMSTSGRLKLV